MTAYVGIVRLGIVRWAVAGGGAVAITIAGCGGGGDSQQTSSAAPAAHASTASPSYQAGPAPAPAGGAFSGFSGGGGGGGGRVVHGQGPSGGIAGALYERTVRQRELTERQHRGPERLDGTDPAARRAADWASATGSAHGVTSPGDDDCDRLWSQHVATTEAYHATRRDGLHSATSAARERAFLEQCRATPEDARQCLDRTYLIAHRDECDEVMHDEGAAAHSKLQSAARETPIPGHRTPPAAQIPDPPPT